jgi:hypothetical protein
MFSRNLLAVMLVTVLTVGCGQNSTKDKDTTGTNDTTTNGTNTIGPAADVPVSTPLEVPEATRQAFHTKYPTATNVNWSRYAPYDLIDWTWTGWPALDTSDYMVTYSDKGIEYRAWYDQSNNWVGTVYHLSDQKGLPEKVTAALNSHYSGYTVVSVTQENDKNRTAYEIKMEKDAERARILIDENGKILKKTVTADGTKTKEKTM